MTFGGGEDNDEETRRVQELEAELGNIRQAFEEYIATTQDLEIDLDKELQDMRTFIVHCFPSRGTAHSFPSFFRP
jgi:hypothetical protein